MFLLVESRHIPARLIQTSPPADPDGSPVGAFTIIDLDLSRYDSIARRFQKERTEGLSFLKAGIDTRSATYNRLIERIEQVAIASRDPVLLAGPTGSGKSQLARRIYDLKKARRQVGGELVEVNCATLRGDAAMSTLFGHVRGAYTGAAEARGGMLRKADKGVLFLDEIGELGLDEQAMLLRAIEDKTFFPVGSDRAVQSDFQLIAGTNRDLAERVVGGRFREDLLARINLWTFNLPGLRERPEDIEPNLDFELERVGDGLKQRLTMSREARERFLSFARASEARWSANFRDFGAAVRRMATLCEGGRISVAEVDDEVERLRLLWRRETAADSERGDRGAQSFSEPADGFRTSRDALGRAELVLPRRESQGHLERLMDREGLAALDRFDRVQLEAVVQVCRTARSLSDAGRTLFAASRAARSSTNDADRLRKYLARFGLTMKAIQSG